MQSVLKCNAPATASTERTALEQFRNDLIEKLLNQHEGAMSDAENGAAWMKCIYPCIVA